MTSGGKTFGKRASRTAGSRAAIGAVLLAGTALAGLASPASAQTAETAAQRTFNIPSQPLADAIMDYGAQSGVQVTAGADLVAGRTSSAVSGSFAPAEALSRMLAGTGLTFRFIRANVVTLEPIPQTAGGDGAIQLGPVRV
ncbi:MAG: STN domain-containing protein, partial [Sphingobium sp.]